MLSWHSWLWFVHYDCYMYSTALPNLLLVTPQQVNSPDWAITYGYLQDINSHCNYCIAWFLDVVIAVEDLYSSKPFVSNEDKVFEIQVIVAPLFEEWGQAVKTHNIGNNHKTASFRKWSQGLILGSHTQHWLPAMSIWMHDTAICQVWPGPFWIVNAGSGVMLEE